MPTGPLLLALCAAFVHAGWNLLLSRARDLMFEATDSKHAPWTVIRSDDKRRARLNCIAHVLKTIPYKKVSRDKVKLPKRADKGRYDDQVGLRDMNFVAERY